MAVLKDVMPIVPKGAWYSYPPSNAVPMAGPVSVGTLPSASVGAVPLRQAYQSAAAAPMPLPLQQPWSHIQQTMSDTMPHNHSLPPEYATAQTTAAVAVPATNSNIPISAPFPSDPYVVDIPMPTPVSVLLRTSDDFISEEPMLYNEQQQEPLLETMPSSSSAPTAGVAVAGTNYGEADFVIPEHVNSCYDPTSAGSLLRSTPVGHRHQSAPDFSHPSLLPAPMGVIHESSNLNNSSTIGGGNNSVGDNLNIGDFSLDDLPPIMMEADDWAIGEGFDMDVDQGAA